MSDNHALAAEPAARRVAGWFLVVFAVQCGWTFARLHMDRRAQLRTLGVERDALIHERAVLQTRGQVLQQQLAERGRELASARATHERLRGELRALERSLEDANRARDEERETVARLGGALQRARASRDRALADARASEARRVEIARERDQVRAALDRADRERDEAETRLHTTASQYFELLRQRTEPTGFFGSPTGASP